jgi:hypothetical protein
VVGEEDMQAKIGKWIGLGGGLELSKGGENG